MMWEEVQIQLASIFVNLIILLLMVPLVISTWYFFVKYINNKLGYDLKKIYDLIYSNPYSAVAMRIGTMAILAYLVGIAFNRPV